MSSSIVSKFQVNQKTEDAYSQVWNALTEVLRSTGINNLTILQEIPYSSNSAVRKPSYVLLQYRRGLLGLSWRQIELKFSERATYTIVSISWAYPTFEYEIKSNGGFTQALWMRNASNARQGTINAVEWVKNRVGGLEITESELVNVKEIIKEKQVIVKVRCEYCGNLYDECLDKCSTCGAHGLGKGQSKQNNFCPYCGITREQNNIFCWKCGKKLPEV